MPRKRLKPPAHRRHKTHDRGYVTLNGKRLYLGAGDHDEAVEKYDRAIEMWIARGRKPLSPEPVEAAYLVEDLVADYWEYLQKRYVNSREPGEIRYSLRALIQHMRANGRRISRYAPYGSDLSPDGRGLVTSTAEVKIIAKIAKFEKLGRSPGWIAKRLTEQGILTKRGRKVWSAKVVRTILRRIQGEAA